MEVAALADGDYSFEDYLDDGSPIRVRIRVYGDEMAIDFTGTGPEVVGNLNAPHAVTIAAIFYVMRSMVGSSAQIPLNPNVKAKTRVKTPAEVKAMKVDFAAAATHFDAVASYIERLFLN